MKQHLRFKTFFRLTITSVIITGIIAADHKIESLFATYDIKIVERTVWDDYQAYLQVEQQNKEAVSNHAIKQAPEIKKTKATTTAKTSAIIAPPKPAAFAQAKDQIGAYLRR